MTLVVPDLTQVLDRVSRALASLKDLPPAARIEGARLAEFWIRETAAFDAQFPTLAVEVPFFFFLDKFTVVVGVQDRWALDAAGLFGCEWKTTKEKTRYWDEDKWLRSISNGHQVKVYALAQRCGWFVVPSPDSAMLRLMQQGAPDGEIVLPDIMSTKTLWKPAVKNPRVMVRAISKSSPPEIWPSEGQALLSFDSKALIATSHALSIRAEQIRRAREMKTVPWQLPGIHCENRFSHTMCPFYEKYCREHRHPKLETHWGAPSPTDPGLAALEAAGEMLRVPVSDPRVVVISASSYETTTECQERYRIEGTERVAGYYQDELDKGSALHAALAEYFRSYQKS